MNQNTVTHTLDTLNFRYLNKIRPRPNLKQRLYMITLLQQILDWTQ